MNLVEWSELHSEEFLSPLGNRWSHSRGVATKASSLAEVLLLPDREILVAASYLHDIGYAPVLATLGFHPLDGGRHMRDLGHERLASLIAYHGGSAEEALLRDLSDALSEFRREDSEVARLLDYCDLTVGPEGEAMTPQQRLADVESRYGPEHVVTQGLRAAWPRLTEEFEWAQRKLAEAGHPR